MIAYRSGGRTSRYIVLRGDTEEIVPNVLLEFIEDKEGYERVKELAKTNRELDVWVKELLADNPDWEDV